MHVAGEERGLALEAVDRLERLDEGVLHQLTHILVDAKPNGEARQSARVPLDDRRGGP